MKLFAGKRIKVVKGGVVCGGGVFGQGSQATGTYRPGHCSSADFATTRLDMSRLEARTKEFDCGASLLVASQEAERKRLCDAKAAAWTCGRLMALYM